MIVRFANIFYFLGLLVPAGAIVGLYFLLRNKSEAVKKWTLFGFLALALALHFLKLLFPPYSTNETYLYRDSWFINICGANIFLFPFIYLSKSKRWKDYMFVMGLLGGGLALLYPTEALNKTIENPDYFDTFRFYAQHAILIGVPLLSAMLNVHRPSYKRVLWGPTLLLVVMLFIMINQVLQSELGFVPRPGEDFFYVYYRNNSLIWGPEEEVLGELFKPFCPPFFKYVPVGEYAGQEKYWPWFWMICPVYVYITTLGFGLISIFDHKNIKEDFVTLKNRIAAKKNK